MHEPISITLPGDPTDPREVPDLPGVIIHRVPPMHPDDLTVVDGIPCTSVSRTLLDLAQVMDDDELRGCFARVEALGLLDLEAVRASRSRVEWRPSLPRFDALLAEVAERLAPGK